MGEQKRTGWFSWRAVLAAWMILLMAVMIVCVLILWLYALCEMFYHGNITGGMILCAPAIILFSAIAGMCGGKNG